MLASRLFFFTARFAATPLQCDFRAANPRTNAPASVAKLAIDAVGKLRDRLAGALGVPAQALAVVINEVADFVANEVSHSSSLRSETAWYLRKI
jgi:hypothetical protein